MFPDRSGCIANVALESDKISQFKVRLNPGWHHSCSTFACAAEWLSAMTSVKPVAISPTDAWKKNKKKNKLNLNLPSYICCYRPLHGCKCKGAFWECNVCFPGHKTLFNMGDRERKRESDSDKAPPGCPSAQLCGFTFQLHETSVKIIYFPAALWARDMIP